MKGNVGLKLNELKTKCYFSKFCKNRGEVFEIQDVKEGNLLIKYLGVPLSSTKIMDREYSELITKLRVVSKDGARGYCPLQEG